jgi:hypothetical protein
VFEPVEIRGAVLGNFGHSQSIHGVAGSIHGRGMDETMNSAAEPPFLIAVFAESDMFISRP